MSVKSGEDQLAKTGQDEFAVLFDRFVGEVAERIEEHSSEVLSKVVYGKKAHPR